MKPQTILVLGGCRSGKSRQALALAETMPGKKLFIATCIPGDDEMNARVKQHQQERASHWITTEAPLLLPETLNEHNHEGNILLVDCLTLWISNLLLSPAYADKIPVMVEHLTDSLKAAVCPILLVSNEVGLGIVPGDPLSRKFRDLVGQTNQAAAEIVDQVILMTAGIPLYLKSACQRAKP